MQKVKCRLCGHMVVPHSGTCPIGIKRQPASPGILFIAGLAALLLIAAASFMVNQ
jgi:hypothetical protein